MEHLVTVRCHAPRSFHPFRVVELVGRLIAAGMNEAMLTTQNLEVMDRDAEDAVCLDGIKTRILFYHSRLALRSALEAYYESKAWVAAGYDVRVFDELGRALGGRNLTNAPTTLPDPTLISVSYAAGDLQRDYKLSAEEAEAFLLRHEKDIHAVMLKAGNAAILAAAEAEDLQRS